MSREPANLPRRRIQIRECAGGNDDFSGRRAGLEIFQDEDPDRRGQIAPVAIAVDLAYQAGQRRVAYPGNFLQGIPESLFLAHAGLEAGDNN